MRSLRGFLLLGRHAFATTLSGRRLLVLVLLAAVPVGVSVLVVEFDQRLRLDDFLDVVSRVVLQAVAPLVALFLGVAVLGDEIDGRTITYLFTRPVPRPVVFLARLLGAACGFAVLLALSVTACGAVFGGHIDLSAAEIGGSVAVALLGFLVYVAIFAALRAFLRRALFIGFFLGIIFEGMIANLPATRLSLCSVWHHTAVLLTRLFEDRIHRMPRGLLATETAAGSLQVLLGVLLVAVALGAWKVHAREVRVPSAVA